MHNPNNFDKKKVAPPISTRKMNSDSNLLCWQCIVVDKERRACKILLSLYLMGLVLIDWPSILR